MVTNRMDGRTSMTPTSEVLLSIRVHVLNSSYDLKDLNQFVRCESGVSNNQYLSVDKNIVPLKNHDLLKTTIIELFSIEYIYTKSVFCAYV